VDDAITGWRDNSPGLLDGFGAQFRSQDAKDQGQLRVGFSLRGGTRAYRSATPAQPSNKAMPYWMKGIVQMLRKEGGSGSGRLWGA
jgi:hypothetical protein